jgi:RNA polymerase sigma-32 factor
MMTKQKRQSSGKSFKGRKSRAISPEVLPPEHHSNEDPENSLDESPETGADTGIEIEEPSEDEIASSNLPTPAVSIDPELKATPHQDPLKRYLEEIRRYPLLEPHEEFALATKLQKEGDLAAAKALVSANLRLVVKIAFEYKNFYSNVLDLIQEGNIGLMKAVSKYDPSKGARLGYYASWWIRSYILKYLLDNFRLVRVGTTQAQKKLFYHLMREKERLEAQGLLAGPRLLAEKLNVREKDVIEMEQRLSGQGAEMSLDAPVSPSADKATSHLDLLVDQAESADESMARQELLRLLQSKLPEFQKSLNEKEQRILKDRLLAEEPKTLQEVADLYGLTRERARQIEAKVIEKLRVFLKPELPEL